MYVCDLYSFVFILSFFGLMMSFAIVFVVVVVDQLNGFYRVGWSISFALTVCVARCGLTLLAITIQAVVHIVVTAQFTDKSISTQELERSSPDS